MCPGAYSGAAAAAAEVASAPTGKRVPSVNASSVNVSGFAAAPGAQGDGMEFTQVGLPNPEQSQIWAGMIHPMTKFRLSGFIWYQVFAL